MARHFAVLLQGMSKSRLTDDSTEKKKIQNRHSNFELAKFKCISEGTLRT